MSFLDAIEHIQQKPRSARMRVLTVTVASIMALIVGVWLLNLRATFDPNTASVDTITRPFAVLKDIVTESFNTAKDQIKSF